MLILFMFVLPLSFFAQEGSEKPADKAQGDEAAKDSFPTTLIDFSTLTADKDGQNEGTTLSYKENVGTVYRDIDTSKLQTSLAIPNWIIQMRASADTPVNNNLSEVKQVMVSSEAPDPYKDKAVLGFRIHFPEGDYASSAEIKPPFVIPAFFPKAEGEDGYKFTEKGIIPNVGTIKNVSVSVFGLNFPHKLYLLLRDQNNRLLSLYMGNLNFASWKVLKWNNEDYVNDVRKRKLKKVPLYPQNQAFLRFEGFLLVRDRNDIGGDFVSYIKDVKVEYDKFIDNDLKKEIDHEKEWQVRTTEEKRLSNQEKKRLGEKEILLYIEGKKKFPAPAQDEKSDSVEAPAEGQ